MRFYKPEEYQPKAWALFHQLKEILSKELPVARIEHIGSSSIEGAYSKGDLDIFVGVEREKFNDSIKVLQNHNFKIKEGSFRSDELCPFESNNFDIDVGIQLVVNNSEFEDFLIFRDLLQLHPEMVADYNKLKLDSQGLPQDKYRKVKSAFIEKLLSTNKA